jgi:lipopolysaccharide transport system ATP-binding protein
MRRSEIIEKFDEIVSFAEVERFIDTPVKRYSSGMYVRLAFAVAAHLETDILLVDEVLAVGDSEFQKKCLGKMGEISNRGRTVLFVSHNMGAISTLTEKSLWLQDGGVRAFGPTREVVDSYISVGYQASRVWRAEHENNKPMQILRAEVEPEAVILDVRKGFNIRIDYVVRKPVQGAVVSVILHATDHAPILSTEDVDTTPSLLRDRQPGHYRTTVHIPGDWLAAGTYLLRLHCGVVNHVIFNDISALQFELTETGDPNLRLHKRAYMLPYLPWMTEISQAPENSVPPAIE